ncbi:MAG: hypothetical protein HKN15_12955 [Xanthomonadales bacterium]|nr:hypothetical protein [Xanthomonadales bacterium]
MQRKTRNTNRINEHHARAWTIDPRRYLPFSRGRATTTPSPQAAGSDTPILKPWGW